MKEKRNLKIIYTKGGSGSITTKITLPKKWMDEMNLSKENRDVTVEFDGEKIVIKKLDVPI